MDGWAKFGNNLAGAFGGDTGAAYSRGQESAARVQTLLLTAKQKRDEAMAQEQLQAEMAKAGIPPEQASVISTALRAGYNPEQISGYRGDVQEQGFRGGAVERALAGDFTGANANLFGVANGPQALPDVQDGMLLSNVFAEGAPTSVTPVGQARIGQADAAATASYARANLANTQAAVGGYNPNTGRGGGAQAAFTAPAQASLLAALGQGEAGEREVPEGDYRDFILFGQANPHLRSGEERLAAYVAAKAGGGPKIIDPTMPGSMTIRPPSPSTLAGALSGVGPDGVQFVIDDPQNMPPAVVQGIMAQDPAAAAANVAADPQAPAGAAPAQLTKEFAMQALRDAREAISAGKISREAARARLRANGMPSIAERL